MMLSHWPCFTGKFFIIWIHKTLKLIFHTQSSCPRNICTEHWRKLSNLTAFLGIFSYLKNKNSSEHLQKVLVIVLFIYFPGKIKSFFTVSGWSGCFEFLFWFYFLKYNRYFSACRRKLASFPSNFASIFSAIKYNSSALF